MNKFWIAPAIAGILLMGNAACVTTGDGQGIEAVEQMNDLDFSRWQLYIQLGVKIAANRALEEGLVTEEELDLAATALETATTQSLAPGTGTLIGPLLSDSGLNNDELTLILLIVENELLARGALDWINPDTGVMGLSPRTQIILNTAAGSLRAASVVTETEKLQYQEMQ